MVDLNSITAEELVKLLMNLESRPGFAYDVGVALIKHNPSKKVVLETSKPSRPQLVIASLDGPSDIVANKVRAARLLMQTFGVSLEELQSLQNGIFVSLEIPQEMTESDLKKLFTKLLELGVEITGVTCPQDVQTESRTQYLSDLQGHWQAWA